MRAVFGLATRLGHLPRHFLLHHHFPLPTGEGRRHQHDAVSRRSGTHRLEAIQRGDIVVFRYPRDPSKSFIKRVVALAGDHIQIQAGQVYVNGKQVYEDYVPVTYEDERSYPEIVVPPDSYFVLGDHRSLSNDSRDFGPVNQRFIYGKAVFGYWPMDKMGRVR
jgi:signal peptidase I